jgi:DHA1 family multidrug resistance protein-like MFS transporter
MPGIIPKIKRELSFIRGNVFIIIITYGINRFVNAMHGPFKSLYFRELGASPLLIGLMNSVGFIILALIRIPGAFIADKHGRKKIIVTFTYGVAISLLIFAFAPDWRFLVIGTAIYYLSHIYQPALQAIEADSTPKEKRGMGYSAIQVLPMIPAIISPVLGGYMVERMGLEQGMRIAFVFAFLGLLTTAILRSLFLKETLEDAEELRLNDLSSGFKDSLGSIYEAWKTMSGRFNHYIIILLFGSVGRLLRDLFLALYAMDIIGVTSLQWSLIGTAQIAVSIVVGLPVGWVVDKIERKRALLLGHLLSAPILFLIAFSRGFIPLLFLMISSSVAIRVQLTSFTAEQADLIPKEMRGRLMGMMGTVGTLWWAIVSSVFGFLYQIDPVKPFILTIIFDMVTIAIILFRY